MSQTANTSLKGQPRPCETLNDNLALLGQSIRGGNRAQVENMLMVLRTRQHIADRWPGHIHSDGVAAAIRQAEDYLSSEPNPK